MLNLVLLTESLQEYGRQHPECPAEQTTHCLLEQDATTECVFVADRKSLHCYKAEEEIWTCACPPSAGCLCGIHYSQELEALVVVYSSGRICLVDENGGIKEASRIDEGICCVEWSPDEEMVLAVTNNRHVLLMQPSNWDVVMDVALVEKLEDGSYDSMEFLADATWRGDGQLAAVCYGDQSKRSINIFETPSLRLKATAQAECELAGCIAWQPNGRHLYAAASMNDMSAMCLFESNGLGHGSFDLRGQGKVMSAAWSLDSQLLTVVLQEASIWTVQIWRRSNWRWYLKYERQWEIRSGSVCVQWDIGRPLLLHVLLNRRLCFQHVKLAFSLNPIVSRYGTAAVTDGHLLQLTPFRHVVIPPPLSAAVVPFKSSVLTAAFYSDPEIEKVAAILTSHEIGFAVCTDTDHWDEMEPQNVEGDYVIIQSSPLANTSINGLMRSANHLLWLDKSTIALFGCGTGELNAHDVMVTVTLVPTESGYECSWSRTHPLSFSLLGPVGFNDGNLLLQSVDGDIYSVDVSDLSSLRRCPELSFPSPCPITIIGKGHDGFVVVGLMPSGKVYQGTSLVTERVTSMIKHVDAFNKDILLLTTKENKLIIKKFDDLFQPQTQFLKEHTNGEVVYPQKRSGATAGMYAAMTPHQCQTKKTSLFERDIEQGARCIASPPSGVEVILQIPRGNLEVISPRLFVLQEILVALNDKNFRKAWQIATLHRVDLNVIVDFNWPQFLDETHEFVSAIESSDICDLMTALHQWSLFEPGSVYSASLPEDWVMSHEEVPDDKVTTVCSALRVAMMEIDEDKYCKAIVISYARCDPPDLENALLSVKSLRMKEINDSAFDVDGQQEVSRAGEALKHLMLYIETAELYRVALGLYDLSLAYMVITHAQRDPGEYQIELEQFASVKSESYRCALIDRYLHRYSRCLTHLLASGPDHFKEAIEIATEHGLFHEMLSQMDSEDERRKEVLTQYGHWLKSKGMQEDAGAAFLAAQELNLAMDAYQSSGDWQMVFIIAGRLNLTELELHELALAVVEDLKSMERFGDAATVCLEYLQNAAEAVAFMTEAREWREAIRLCHRINRQDLITSTIAPSAAATVKSYINKFTENTRRVQKYTERLKEVRAKRQAMELTVGETGAVEGDQAASTVAGLSIYTDRTQVPKTQGSATALTVGGKKPKKSQRSKGNKKLKIKQGSPEEEAALIAHVIQMKPGDVVLSEVSELSELLIALGFFDDAQKLQSTLDVFIKSHKSATDDLQKSLEKSDPNIRWKWDILRSA